MAEGIRREQLKGLTKPFLKAFCIERGLAVSGKNEVLVNRILVHEGFSRPEGDLRFMPKDEVVVLPDATILNSIQRFGDNQLTSVPHKRKTPEFIMSACEVNPKSLKHCPRLGDDYAFVSGLLDRVPAAYPYLSISKRADSTLASKAIRQDPNMFLSAPETLRNSPDFVLPLLAIPADEKQLAHADLFRFTGPLLRTPEGCLLAAKNCSSSYALRVAQEMPYDLRRSPTIMEPLITKDALAMSCAGDNLKMSFPFAKRLSSLNGRVFPYLNKNFQESKVVVANALVQCPEMILYTSIEVDPFIELAKNYELKYLDSKDNVFQFLRMLARPAGEGGKLAHVARLCGQTRVKFTIVSYLMPITSHPNQNAMTRKMRDRLSHTIAQLDLAAQIQKSPTLEQSELARQIQMNARFYMKN